jgi:hypothetical protein
MIRRLAFAAVLLAPVVPAQAADLAPHRAAYAVRIGSAANAPQIGEARQRLAFDCRAWRLERDVLVDLSLTASFKVQIESRLKGEELLAGPRLNYELLRLQNGQRSAISGRVDRSPDGRGLVSNIKFPNGPAGGRLPDSTVLPVRALATMLKHLSAGESSFALTLFDAETVSDALEVEARIVADGSTRPARLEPPTTAPIKGRWWPVSLSFARARDPAAGPLFQLTALVHESGLIDRLTIPVGLLSITADLTDYAPLPRPDCPRS